jgi:hypothetical protein
MGETMGKSDNSQSGPFGMADGASEDEKGFIKFTNHGDWGDLEFSDSSLRERIFVGRRGSGKSRYLGEQERVAAKKMLIFEQKTEAISIIHLRKLHREFSDTAEREEAWIRLWHAAINLGLASFLLTRHDAGKTLSQEDRDMLTDLVRQYLGFANTPFSVVASLNQILALTEGRRNKLDHLLSKPDWTVIEHLVAKSVAVTSPVAMFIDSLDENFRYAPAESAQAQLGLLLYLARTLTDTSRSNRSHMFVTVRDVIYSQFLNHEQGEKYANETHWKLLDWRKSAARYFFERKIDKLPTKFLRKADEKENLFERWLGVSHVWNPERKVEEEVGDFLLRHTRFLPREVVEIGNALCNAMGSQAHGSQTLNIWSLVIKQAEHIGERALQVLYDHIIALSDDTFPSDKERSSYRALLVDGLGMFKGELTSEVFSQQQLRDADAMFLEACADNELDLSLGNLLWQHGLIGYLYTDETRSDLGEIALFYHAVGGTEGSSAYQLPAAERYRLHASLVDARQVRFEEGAPAIGSVDEIL